MSRYYNDAHADKPEGWLPGDDVPSTPSVPSTPNVPPVPSTPSVSNGYSGSSALSTLSTPTETTDFSAKLLEEVGKLADDVGLLGKLLDTYGTAYTNDAAMQVPPTIPPLGTIGPLPPLGIASLGMPAGPNVPSMPPLTPQEQIRFMDIQHRMITYEAMGYSIEQLAAWREESHHSLLSVADYLDHMVENDIRAARFRMQLRPETAIGTPPYSNPSSYLAWVDKFISDDCVSYDNWLLGGDEQSTNKPTNKPAMENTAIQTLPARSEDCWSIGSGEITEDITVADDSGHWSVPVAGVNPYASHLGNSTAAISYGPDAGAWPPMSFATSSRLRRDGESDDVTYYGDTIEMQYEEWCEDNLPNPKKSFLDCLSYAEENSISSVWVDMAAEDVSGYFETGSLEALACSLYGHFCMHPTCDMPGTTMDVHCKHWFCQLHTDEIATARNE